MSKIKSTVDPGTTVESQAPGSPIVSPQTAVDDLTVGPN